MIVIHNSLKDDRSNFFEEGFVFECLTLAKTTSEDNQINEMMIRIKLIFTFANLLPYRLNYL